MILALSTSGPTTQMALLPDGSRRADEVQAEALWESGRGLADGLLDHLRVLLDGQGIDWPDLTGLIIFSGPGSFTSLRIGHTVMNTLASSLALPIASAGGDDWITSALVALPNRISGRPVWPEYGAEANITRPKQA